MDDTLIPVKVRDLKADDKVDMEKSTLPFKYTDQQAEFEYAVVDETKTEPSGLVHVAFRNMTDIALGPDDELMVCR